VTRSHPGSLIACLESYLENCRRHDRAPEFVVTDDSPEPDVQDGTRTALGFLKHRFGAHIRYAGRRERIHFAEALAGASAVPVDVVRFGLFGDDRCALSTGANRNSLLLDTLDGLVLSVDDDTRCQIAAAPDSGDEPVLFAGYDPTELWFFGDGASATESLPLVDIDVLRGHEALLGCAVADVGGPAQASGRVAITMHGLVGDSGMGSPRYYLSLTGPSRERLVASLDAYQSAFRSRAILRTVRRPTFSAGPFCMTTFFGLDNRLLLPPFFPVQRNADGIFGLVLHKCVEGSHVAFLPSVLLHAPAAPRVFEPDAIWTDARSVRMADIVIDCVFAHDVGGTDLSDATRFAHLGRHLQWLGSLTLPDFEAHVRSLQQYRTMAFITALESLVQTHAALPAFWSEDVKRMMAEMSKSAGSADYLVPRDLLAGREAGEARRLSQELVTRFGELLEAWPTIVAAARRLRANGCRLTDPV
jgi:hypothetical protein